MARAFDGSFAPDTEEIPCGTVNFDEESGMSYRCWRCMAVVGSIAMPAECARLLKENVPSEKELVKKKLGFEYKKFNSEKP